MNANLKWYPLTNNRAHNVIQPHEGGLIQFKLQIVKREDKASRRSSTKVGLLATSEQIEREIIADFNWKNHPSWMKPPPQRYDVYKLRCYIFQCKNLPSADSDGTADPKVRVFAPLGKDEETSVVRDNLNPIFTQVLDINYQFSSLEDAPPVVLSVFDSDENENLFGGDDDFMGRAFINLGDYLIQTSHIKQQLKQFKLQPETSNLKPRSSMRSSYSSVKGDHHYECLCVD